MSNELTDINDIDAEIVKPKFYEYRQNNSGGIFDYDSNAGISVTVYVEAYSPEQANCRAEEIGLYFDGYGDCDCCGARWIAKSYWGSTVEAVPAKDEVLVRDDNADHYSFIHKWRKEGEYDTFVHPLNGEFYGAHAHMEHINRR